MGKSGPPPVAKNAPWPPFYRFTQSGKTSSRNAISSFGAAIPFSGNGVFGATGGMSSDLSSYDPRGANGSISSFGPSYDPREATILAKQRSTRSYETNHSWRRPRFAGLSMCPRKREAANMRPMIHPVLARNALGKPAIFDYLQFPSSPRQLRPSCTLSFLKSRRRPHISGDR